MTTMPNETSMSNADRLRVQDTLRRLDYYKGQLDGVFGPLTRAAIRRFQGDIGAQVTGRLTAEEVSRLVSTAPSARWFFSRLTRYENTGSIPTHRKGIAWFHRTKERYESFTDAVALGNLASEFFLGKLRNSEVLHGPSRCASRLVGCRFDAPCEFFSKGLEVLDQHPASAQVKVHLQWLEKQAQNATKANPIESTQNCCNVAAEFGKKWLWDAVSCWGKVLHTPLVPALTASRSLWLQLPFSCVRHVLQKACRALKGDIFLFRDCSISFLCCEPLFLGWDAVHDDNKPVTRLIHNRPGPVGCENAWYRFVTSQQRTGPEKGDCG
jgi:hypothetical protein